MTCKRKSTWHNHRKEQRGPCLPLPPDHPVCVRLARAGMGVEAK